MGIVIDRQLIDDIPILMIHEQDKQAAPLPVVIYFHGFTSAKEQNLPTAYLLAEQGYRVILPEALHHGERRGNITNDEIQFAFWKIVQHNLVDLHKLMNWLTRGGLLEAGRLGVAGTSMGGITTAAALTQFEQVKVAGLMMGSAKLQYMAHYLLKGIEQQGIELPYTNEEITAQVDELGKIDLSQKIEVISGRPILIWHGEEDRVVPFDHAVEFYEQLARNGENVKFVSEKGRDHKVSREGMIELTNWMKTYL
ncbi:alpha/beta fold hydrolase [Alkalibacillus haloalkaliphilus]|uniref:Putative esterase YitV n=1 Tax=Alkalibacillus haloalkaliphilus TaxID=94136 RepID=A0A511W3M1_9BACI|nr:alpha/beta fold hydrolase [Alkalibacillus haloalkaliphilus]GEN45660.1 putative esterase YitV [Alkalibacillus haloalkaliphilus]